MSRQQRRAKKRKGRSPVGSVVDIGVGHLGEGDPNCGTAVNCYVCSTPHRAHGLAQIEDKADTIHVPLCEACVQAGDFNAISEILRHARSRNQRGWRGDRGTDSRAGGKTGREAPLAPISWG